MTIKRTLTTTKEVEIEIPSYWKFGPTFASVISENQVIQVCNQLSGNTDVAKLNFLSSVEWEPCTQDEFVEAYVFAMNRICELSGIQHLPLDITYDNTSNPES